MKKAVLLCFIILSLAGCTSLWGSFTHLKPDYSALPADDLRKVAAAIEKAVAEGERSPNIHNQGKIIVETERIQQAIRTRAARFNLLDAFRSSGFCYEKPDGRIAIKPSNAYKKAGTRRDRDRNALLIYSENTDRWAIYEGIIESSNLSPKALSAIERIFYEERIPYMKKGQKYKNDAGEIVTIQ